MVTLVSLLSLSLSVVAQITTTRRSSSTASVSRTSSAVSSTVSISSAATPTPSFDPFVSFSAGCKSAIAALESESSCPIKDPISSFMNPSGSSNSGDNIPIECSNPACKDYYNSVNDLLSKGACSQDKISLPLPSDSSGNIAVSTFGLFTSTSYALTCQKTSDNQGYCGASTKVNDSFVISLYVIAPLITGLEIPAIKDNKGVGKQICTDCSKNGLATFLTNPNLSKQERSSVQKVSSDLDNYCGDSYTIVPGVGGVGDSSNAISGALSTVAILAAIFTQL